MNDSTTCTAENGDTRQLHDLKTIHWRRNAFRLAKLILLIIILSQTAGCGFFQKTVLNPMLGRSGRDTDRTPPSRLNTSKLVHTARQYIGTPYRSGGTSSSGMDCSGFTLTVFRRYQVSLPRNSREQSTVGIPVKRWELAAGDLVFFDTDRNGSVNHVGIYVGEHKIIHASPGNGVIVDSLLKDYFTRSYVTARRIPGPSSRRMASK